MYSSRPNENFCWGEVISHRLLSWNNHHLYIANYIFHAMFVLFTRGMPQSIETILLGAHLDAKFWYGWDFSGMNLRKVIFGSQLRQPQYVVSNDDNLWRHCLQAYRETQFTSNICVLILVTWTIDRKLNRNIF